jgi:hypothetical protein
MTPTNEPLDGIQARIEELQKHIANREAQIKARTLKLKEEIEAELSPVKMVEKHPFAVTTAVFAAGLLLGRVVRGRGNTSASIRPVPCAQEERSPSRSESALSAIGLEALRSAKELGFACLQRYIEKKIT